MVAAAKATAEAAPVERAASTLLRDHKLHLVEAIPWIIAVAVFFAFPGYRLLATLILVMILFALSLDLIVGYAGIVSLGHTALFGTGAYAAALMASQVAPWFANRDMRWLALVAAEPVVGLVAGVIFASLIGLVSGWVILRTHGLTLLMLTMALTITLFELAKDLDRITIAGRTFTFTGGFDGLNFSNSQILGLVPFDIVYYSSNYWYALAFLFIGFVIARAIVYSPFGRSLHGIRENVTRMHAIGSPVQKRKLAIYVIASALAGAAGAIWVQVQGNITIAVYEFELAGAVLIMIILGGTGRLYGAFIGATVYMILENVTEQVLGTDPPYWELAVGLALVLTVLFARRGLLGIFEDLSEAIRRKAI